MTPGPRPILFVSYPESGLLNPMLVLAGELSRRDVADLHFATDDNRAADVAALKVGSPVQFAPLGPVVPELSAVTWDDAKYREVTQRSRFGAHRAVIRHTFLPRARIDKYRRLAEVVDRVRPALMVVESMCQYGWELAITRKIPYVLGVPYVASNLLTSHIPFGRTHTPRGFPVPHSGLPYPMSPAQRLRNLAFKLRTVGMFATREMGARARLDAQVRAELGIAPEAGGLMARIDGAEAVLCYSVPELDYPFTPPPAMHLVGALVPPLPEVDPDGAVGADGDLSAWLDGRGSVVYVAFGTITRLTGAEVASMVAVARRLRGRHHVLWKLPADQQHLLPPPGELPDNLRIETWIPSQLDVLAHPSVRAFLTHGGGNSYHEGLYFGKPLVLRPLWVDCADQAVRAQDIGAGLVLDRPDLFGVDDVVDKLTRVLDEPAYRERAENLARLQQAAGGRRAAADLVLDLITDRP